MEVIEFIDSLFLGKLLGFAAILYAFDRLFIPNIWWFRKLPLLCALKRRGARVVEEGRLESVYT